MISRSRMTLSRDLDSRYLALIVAGMLRGSHRLHFSVHPENCAKDAAVFKMLDATPEAEAALRALLAVRSRLSVFALGLRRSARFLSLASDLAFVVTSNTDF